MTACCGFTPERFCRRSANKQKMPPRCFRRRAQAAKLTMITRTSHRKNSRSSLNAPFVAPVNISNCNNFVAPGNNIHLQHRGGRTRQAKTMAQNFKISLATAFRHLRRGTTPSSDRKTGRDGKTYPAGTGERSISAVERELRLTMQALRRADTKACEREFGVSDDESDLLKKIGGEAYEVLSRWRPADE
jgi:hypothetical protein